MSLDTLGNSIHEWAAVKILARLQSEECGEKDLALALRYLNDFNISGGLLDETTPAGMLAAELVAKKAPFKLTGTD